MTSKRGRKALTIILFNFIAVILGIFAGLVIVFFAGGEPLKALVSIFTDPLLSSAGIQQIVIRFMVLYTMGLGIGLALKAGLWNIGAQGQFIVGMVMVFVTYVFLRHVDGSILFASMILSAIVGGILWILPPAVLRVKFGANEIVITLLLNVVALYFGTYMINGPIRGSGSFGYPITDTLPQNLMFPEITSSITYALPVTVLIGLVFYFIIERTPFGMHARVVGESSETANYAGINSSKIMFITMLTAGGLAGFAGATYVMGYLKHLDAGQFDTSFGLLAVISAMLGRKHMLGIALSSLFIGYITIGTEEMAVSVGVPTSVVYTMEGIMLVGILLSSFILERSRFRRMIGVL
jgi:ABC-type uncharacterized transport system permease subunit